MAWVVVTLNNKLRVSYSSQNKEIATIYTRDPHLASIVWADVPASDGAALSTTCECNIYSFIHSFVAFQIPVNKITWIRSTPMVQHLAWFFTFSKDINKFDYVFENPAMLFTMIDEIERNFVALQTIASRLFWGPSHKGLWRHHSKIS